MRGYSSEKGATDNALAALSHPLRRRLLFTLFEEDQHAAEARLSQDSFPELGQDEFQIELHHVHLPKLEREGYIRWNKDEKTITTGPKWDNIEPLLEVIYSHLNELPPFLRGTPSAAQNGMP